MTQSETGLVVLYDGVCGLCDRTVQIFLKADRRGTLKFAPLQGPTAVSVLAKHGVMQEDAGGFRSIIFVRGYGMPSEAIFLRSEGVLRILSHLGGIWWMLSWLRIIPLFVRDAVYNWVARNRYQWFGKFDACRLLPPEWQSRFLP